MDRVARSEGIAAAGSPSPPEVVVRVLGPVEVTGAARPFRRAWSLDLVVYLALHPGGVVADAWETALWPDRLMAPATRHATVSAARRALGRSGAGPDHLPRSSGRLTLAPSVTTDWKQFQALAATDGTGGPAAWRAALDLVRGRPFDGLRAPDWTVFEGVEARVEDAVVQVALRLSRRLLDEGRGRDAELALRRALLVSPFDERIYRLLLVAGDLQGNPAAVEATMAELVHLVRPERADRTRRQGHGGASPALLDEALALVHPETAAVYRSLSRRCGAGQRVGAAASKA